MLVLSRKAQETIQIGEDISVTILRVKGRTVRIGIEAPTHLKVRRGELPIEPRVHAASRTSNTPRERTTAAAPQRSNDSHHDRTTLHKRFENWPLNRSQMAELMLLASDA